MVGLLEVGILAWIVKALFDTEHDPTITEAVFALVGALAWLVLGLWLAPALFLLVWPRVRAEVLGRAHGPVIGLLGDGPPLSHVVKRFDLCTIVWPLGWSKVHHTLALAVRVLADAAEPRLGELVPGGVGELGVLVALRHEVLVRLIPGFSTGSSELLLELRVHVEVPLGLELGKLLGTGTQSSLCFTDGIPMSLWIHRSVQVGVSGGVAFSLGIVHTTGCSEKGGSTRS